MAPTGKKSVGDSPAADSRAGRSDGSMSQEAAFEQRVAAAVNEQLARLQLGQQVRVVRVALHSAGSTDPRLDASHSFPMRA